MKKMMVTTRKHKGFSLAEVLVVIAIIGILSSLSFIAVAKYKRDLTALDMDASAKELFIAAQNHLSLAESQGLLGSAATGNTEDASNGIYWFLYGELSEDSQNIVLNTPDDAGTILNLMLPDGCIENTIRTSGSYIIRYQKDPAQVLDVFFADKTGDYPYTFSSADYDKLMNLGEYAQADNYRSSSELRKRYGDTQAVIGYYGDEGSAISTIMGEEIQSPVIYLNEGSILSVTIHDPNPVDTPHYLNITFTGKNGPVTIPLLVQRGEDGMPTIVETAQLEADYPYIAKNLSKIISYNSSTGTFKFILDDITTPGLHFAEIFRDTDLIPGEKITIQAEAGNTKAVSNIARSNVLTTNVLFEINDNGEIEINNIRQLENLDPDISGFDPTKLPEIFDKDNDGKTDVQIKQKDNIDFDDFIDEVTQEKGGGPVVIYDIDPDPYDNDFPEGTDDNTFEPINPDYHFDYDGQNKTISNVVIYNDKEDDPANPGQADAGLFGRIEDPYGDDPTHITVKDLELLNFDVTSKHGNAGALAGTLENTNVQGILVTNSPNDSDHQVTAGDPNGDSNAKDGNAGGLVGEMNGGSVNLCAASTYVKSECAANNKHNDGSAGGLIGKVTGEVTVTNSYAGGHTKDSRYQETMTGDARINVQSSNSSGGLIGNAKETGTDAADLTVKYCYTTCSVIGGSDDASASYRGTTGGFIGSANSNTTITDSYAAGKVFDSVKDGDRYTLQTGVTDPVSPFAGSVSGGTYTDNHYLMGVSGKSNAEPTAKGVSVRSYGEAGSFLVEEDSRNTAVTYDKNVAATYENKYTFETISQLNTSLSGADTSTVIGRLINTQYGDWQLPKVSALATKVTNADTLTCEFEITGETEQVILAVTGENSGKTRLLLFDITKLTSGDISVELAEVGKVEPTAADPVTLCALNWSNDVSASQFVWKLNKGTSSITSGATSITLTLDNITEMVDGKNSHFAAQYGDLLLPGEDISILAADGMTSGQGSWNEILTMSDPSTGTTVVAKKTNSLFARSDEDRDTAGESELVAEIAYGRQLQNLDPLVSGLSDKVTAAEVIKNLTWDTDIYAKIYNADCSKSVTGSFVSIYNPLLKSLDGQNHTITGLVVNTGAKGYDDVCTSYASNAGLFRYVDSSFTKASPFALTKLRLDNAVITATGSGHAGSMVAEAAGGLKLDTVLASASSNKVTAASGNAGGLVGLASDSLKINNSAASVYVKASGCAGGLVGKTEGDLDMQISYAGGHTSKAVYVTKKAENYNVCSGTAAGGLVGHVAGGTTVNVTRCFSAASAATTSDSKPAGGIFGKIDVSATLQNLYVIAPVSNVYNMPESLSKNQAPTDVANIRDTNNDSVSGAFIGQIAGGATVNNQKCYYLPDIYTGNTLYNNETISSVAYAGKGSVDRLTETVSLAYYVEDRNGEISAKSASGSMQDHTYSYDDGLLHNKYDSNREYPFSIWTKTSFKTSKSGGSADYYGDWQPVLNESTVVCTVTFKYLVPTDSKDALKADAVAFSGTYNTQTIHKGETNTLTFPTPPTYRTSSDYSNFEFAGWELTYDGLSTPLTINIGANVTRYTLSAAECGGNLTITTKYNPAPKYLVNFYYDESGKNATFTKLSSTRVSRDPQVTYADLQNSASFPSPKTITGYEFEGWYADSDMTIPVDFSSTDVIDQDMNFYAKYRLVRDYTINVNFLYTAEDTLNIENVASLGIQPVTIQFKEGTTFNSSVALPTSVSSLKPMEGGIYYMENNQLLPVAGNTQGFAVSVSSDYSSVAIQTTKALDIYIIYPITGATKNTTYTVEHRLYNKDGSLKDTITYASDLTIPINSRTSGKLYAIDRREEGYVTPTANDIHDITATQAGPNVVYIDYYRSNYELSFDTKGGSYIAPEIVSSGEDISSYFSTDPTRRGYEFAGWTVTKKGDTTVDVNPDGIMPAYNVEATANWTPGTSYYTVIVWKQNINDDRFTPNSLKTYDYEKSFSVSGTTGEVAQIPDTLTSLGETTGASRTVGSKTETFTDFTGFAYNQINSDTDGKTIAADGSTIINVYYDRSLQAINFFRGDRANTLYIEDTQGNNSNAVYGLVDGKYVGLYYDETTQTWVYETTVTETRSGTEYKTVVKKGDTYTGEVYYHNGTGYVQGYGDSDQIHYYYNTDLNEYKKLNTTGSYSFTYTESGDTEYTGTRYVQTTDSYDTTSTQYGVNNNGGLELLTWHKGKNKYSSGYWTLSYSSYTYNGKRYKEDSTATTNVYGISGGKLTELKYTNGISETTYSGVVYRSKSTSDTFDPTDLTKAIPTAFYGRVNYEWVPLTATLNSIDFNYVKTEEQEYSGNVYKDTSARVLFSNTTDLDNAYFYGSDGQSLRAELQSIDFSYQVVTGQQVYTGSVFKNAAATSAFTNTSAADATTSSFYGSDGQVLYQSLDNIKFQYTTETDSNYDAASKGVYTSSTTRNNSTKVTLTNLTSPITGSVYGSSGQALTPTLNSIDFTYNALQKYTGTVYKNSSATETFSGSTASDFGTTTFYKGKNQALTSVLQSVDFTYSEQYTGDVSTKASSNSSNFVFNPSTDFTTTVFYIRNSKTVLDASLQSIEFTYEKVTQQATEEKISNSNVYIKLTKSYIDRNYLGSLGNKSMFFSEDGKAIYVSGLSWVYKDNSRTKYNSSDIYLLYTKANSSDQNSTSATFCTLKNNTMVTVQKNSDGSFVLTTPAQTTTTALTYYPTQTQNVFLQNQYTTALTEDQVVANINNLYTKDGEKLTPTKRNYNFYTNKGTLTYTPTSNNVYLSGSLVTDSSVVIANINSNNLYTKISNKSYQLTPTEVNYTFYEEVSKSLNSVSDTGKFYTSSGTAVANSAVTTANMSGLYTKYTDPRTNSDALAALTVKQLNYSFTEKVSSNTELTYPTESVYLSNGNSTRTKLTNASDVIGNISTNKLCTADGKALTFKEINYTFKEDVYGPAKYTGVLKTASGATVTTPTIANMRNLYTEDLTQKLTPTQVNYKFYQDVTSYEAYNSTDYYDSTSAHKAVSKATTSNMNSLYGKVDGSFVALKPVKLNYSYKYTTANGKYYINDSKKIIYPYTDVYTKSGDSYVAADPADISSTKLYGLVNGVYYELSIKSQPSYTYAENVTITVPKEETVEVRKTVEYTGKRYEKYTESNGSKYSVFEGLYGQPLSDYGYSWPSEKGWSYGSSWSAARSGGGMSYLGEFVFPDNIKTNIYICLENDSPQSTLYFIREDESGNYSIDGCDKGALANYNSNFQFSEKYYGYKVSGYKYSPNDTWRSTQSGGSTSFSGSLYVRYDRLQYTVTFFASRITPENQGYVVESGNLGTKTVKYGTSVTAVTGFSNSITVDSREYTWDGKWYKDPACSVEFDLTKEKMPASNLALYAKYELPKHTVTFELNDPAPALNPATYMAQADSYTLTVYDKYDIADTITDAAGDIKPEYTPVKTGYDFLGWYYNDGATRKTFSPSLGITTDTVVYALWTESDTAGSVDITVKYVNEAGEDLITPEVYAGVAVGEVKTFPSKAISGYYSLDAVKVHVATANIAGEGDKNTVVFTYKVAEMWKYDIEYYVSYKSLGISVEVDHANAWGTESPQFKITAATQTDVETSYQYTSVVYSAPAGYENYKMVSYDCLYSDTTDTTNYGSVAMVHQTTDGSKPVVRFYLEPDASTLNVTDKDYMYDGKSHKTIQSERDDVFVGPSGEKLTLTTTYKYTGTGTEVIDVGSYTVDVYNVLTFSYDDGNGYVVEDYLIRVDQGSINLNITARPITIKSSTASKAYDGNALVLEEFTIIDNGTDKAFSDVTSSTGSATILTRDDGDSDTLSVIFSVQAFRKDPGTEENSFTYNFGDSVKPGNYVVTVVYGSLTVTEN